VGREPLPPHPVDPALDDDLRPATFGELRSLRRWLAVAGVWAVAASAIAIIALLEASKEEPARDPNAVSGSQLSKVQSDLDQRIDRLEERVEGLPDSGDVSKLEARLKKLEDGASASKDDVSQANDQIDELEQRVDQVEQQQDSGGTGGTTTTP
jgi:septal ring factor EnvC (AmiA/AmiB activator)